MPASFLPPPPAWLDPWLDSVRPPEWLLQEAQLKGVLFFNHVLLQSEQALPRTRRLAGRSLQMKWRQVCWEWAFTPAGLFETRPVQARADLVLDLGDVSPTQLAALLWRADRPNLRIEGDVQMAAEINWLVDHVRWRPEEDLARLVGDAQARALALLGQRLIQGLRAFGLGRTSPATESPGSRS
ncbi:MAG: hypothetical protein QM527_13330 [Alphaproteobacteria bacterium]|nr:hypothetical protein [Alphaproteobacteria bacterium]